MVTEGQAKFERKTAIMIAVIGLMGGVLTAIISNWDKIFHNVISETYTDYQPTGDFDTEFRTYFEVSGWRTLIVNTQKEFLNALGDTLYKKYPDRVRSIYSIINAAKDETVRVDDVIEELLPVYRKYYSVNQMQQLNRLYSTAPMREMVKNMPMIADAAAPIQAKFILDLQERIQKSLNRTFPGDGQVNVPQVCIYSVFAPS